MLLLVAAVAARADTPPAAVQTATVAHAAAPAAADEHGDFYQRFKQRVEQNYGVRYQYDYRWRTELKDNNTDFRSGGVLDYTRHGAFDDRYALMRHRQRFALGVKPFYYVLRGETNRHVRTLRDIEIFARVVNEWTQYLDPGRRVWIDELLLDQLYLDAPRPWGVPFSLRAGRQDWRYGAGLIIADGTPLDGTRTLFFDGFRLRWHLDQFLRQWCGVQTLPYSSASIPQTDVDVLFAVNRNENYASLGTGKRSRIARWRDRNARLNDRDEWLAGVYVTSLLWDKSTGATARTWLNRLQSEPYYIFKAEYPYMTSDPFEYTFERDARIHTFGWRWTGGIHENAAHALTFETEWAGQVGDYGKYQSNIRELARRGLIPHEFARGYQPMAAMGGYGALTEHLKRVPFTEYRMPFQPRFKGLIGYLSGDRGQADGGLSTGWHPMFNRENQIFGEHSYIYSDALGMEDGSKWWSNLQLYHFGVTIEPFDPLPVPHGAPRYLQNGMQSLTRMNYTIAYQHLRANTRPFRGQPEFGDGYTRGNALINCIEWPVNDYLTCRLIYEHFWPGSYYDGSPLEQITVPGRSFYSGTRGYRDPAYFIRFELGLAF